MVVWKSKSKSIFISIPSIYAATTIIYAIRIANKTKNAIWNSAIDDVISSLNAIVSPTNARTLI